MKYLRKIFFAIVVIGILVIFIKRDVSLYRRKALTQRQSKILDIVTMHGEVTIDEVARKISKVTRRTLRRDLTTLEGSGYLEKVGKTKGTSYKIK